MHKLLLFKLDNSNFQRVLFCRIPLVAVLYTSAFASSTGTIAGVITNSDGDLIAGATVMAGGTQFKAVTNTNGEYCIPMLAPGEYWLRASITGMIPAIMEGITVVSDQVTRRDIKLWVGVETRAIPTYPTQRNLILENVPSAIHAVNHSKIETMPAANIVA